MTMVHEPPSEEKEKEIPSLTLGPGSNCRVSAGGVTLYCDWDDEEYWIETTPFYSRAALRSAVAVIKAIGLEALEPDEMWAIDYPDGRTRIYLAENPIDTSLALAWPEHPSADWSDRLA